MTPMTNTMVAFKPMIGVTLHSLFKSGLTISKTLQKLHIPTKRFMSTTTAESETDGYVVAVTFVKPDGKKIMVKSKQDKSLYDTVIDNNVDIDGFGACEGTLCCTTCHLIFNQSDYEKVGPPSDEELDMLDLAYGLTDTSRLGCQVMLRKELHPLEVHVPVGINDVREG